MKVLNVIIRRMILLIGVIYVLIIGYDSFVGLPFVFLVFYILLFFIFWWWLISYMNFFWFKDDEGIVIKFPYYRKFRLDEIKSASIDSYSGNNDIVFGSLHTIVLRQDQKKRITIPFSSKGKCDDFIAIIEGNSKLIVSNEYDNSVKKKTKKSKKFLEYNVDTDFELSEVYKTIIKDVIAEEIDEKLNSRLPIEIKKKDNQVIKSKPVIHAEGVYNSLWFQYSFCKQGILLSFDGFELDNKYMTDDYIKWNSFESKDEVYDFIVEGFNHYYIEASK